MRLLLLALVVVSASVADAAPAKQRVLHVVETTGVPGDFEKAIAADATVDTIAAARLPGVAAELAKYDAVIFHDVPAHLLGSAQLVALDTYVAKGGTMFLAGGERSFATGAYQGTRLEQMMPVRFDAGGARDQPDVAVVFVVDRSASLAGKPLERIADGLIAAVGKLAPNDFVAIVTYDDDALVHVRPQRAANHVRIDAELRRLVAGTGTANLLAGLREAHELLSALTARRKHAIVISGSPSADAGVRDLVTDMLAARETVSAVGFAGARSTLVGTIAAAGDGRKYAVTDAAELVKVLPAEVAAASKPRTPTSWSVRIAKKVPPIDGTDVDKAPPLRGFVTTKAKPTAEVLLLTDTGEPLLARWRHGAGTVAAWTSDLDRAWTADWVKWPGYAKFWSQLVRTVKM